mmetsp:Transcript_115779/g.225331  ORF Transcript_115779/g.225331 Transcript_115779/m.225331 type:complete len:640 (+) Transcript_115779:127-2046(+)
MKRTYETPIGLAPSNKRPHRAVPTSSHTPWRSGAVATSASTGKQRLNGVHGRSSSHGSSDVHKTTNKHILTGLNTVKGKLASTGTATNHAPSTDIETQLAHPKSSKGKAVSKGRPAMVAIGAKATVEVAPAGSSRHRAPPEIQANSNVNVREDTAVDTQRIVCRFWEKGNCRNGDQCRFLHPANADQSSKNIENWQASSVNSIPLGGYTSSFSSSNGPKRASIAGHVVPRKESVGQLDHSSRNGYSQMEGVKPAVCMFWARGSCKNGESCRFLHRHSNPEPLPSLSMDTIEQVRAMLEESEGQVEGGQVAARFLGVKKTQLAEHFTIVDVGKGAFWVRLPELTGPVPTDVRRKKEPENEQDLEDFDPDEPLPWDEEDIADVQMAAQQVDGQASPSQNLGSPDSASQCEEFPEQEDVEEDVPVEFDGAEDVPHESPLEESPLDHESPLEEPPLGHETLLEDLPPGEKSPGLEGADEDMQPAVDQPVEPSSKEYSNSKPRGRLGVPIGAAVGRPAGRTRTDDIKGAGDRSKSKRASNLDKAATGRTGPKTQRMCAFDARGLCRNGDRCPFIHVGDDPDQPLPPLDSSFADQIRQFIEERGGTVEGGSLSKEFKGVKKTQLEGPFQVTMGSGGKFTVSLPSE